MSSISVSTVEVCRNSQLVNNMSLHLPQKSHSI